MIATGLRVSLSEDLVSWEDFLSKDDFGNIFQSAVISPAYSGVLKFKVHLVVARLNDEIVGGILTYRRLLPKLPLVNSLYTSYGPIVSKEVKGPIRNKAIQALLRATESLANVGTIKHTFFARSDYIYNNGNKPHEPQHDNIAVFEAIGYKRVSDGFAQTFIVDLEQEPESLLGSFEKRARWALKKAKKLNIKVTREDTQRGLEDFYRLHVETANRQHSIVTPFGFLKRLQEILSPGDMMDIYFAYFDGVPISASIVLNYKHTAYYYMSAALKEYSYTQANTLLQFYIMTSARERGIREYDLYLAPSPHDRNNAIFGLYIFKRSFGGKCVPVLHYEHIFNRLLNFTEDKLKRARLRAHAIQLGASLGLRDQSY
jgi:hypothetical protein